MNHQAEADRPALERFREYLLLLARLQLGDALCSDSEKNKGRKSKGVRCLFDVTGSEKTPAPWYVGFNEEITLVARQLP